MKIEKSASLENNLNSIISICYYGRSGSIFFQSLLDNHPDIISFPGSYLSGYQNWFDSLDNHESKNCVSKFLFDFQVLFDPEYISETPLPCCGKKPGLDLNFHKVGVDANQHLKIEKNIFESALYSLIDQNEEEKAVGFFKKLHIALAVSLNQLITVNTKIVFALHTPALNRAKFIIEGFQDRKFIHVVREPVYSAFSHYKMSRAQGENLSVINILGSMNAYSPLLGEEKNSCSIKLEDLHTKSKETLNKICEYLNIKWSDTLLESTFLGLKWHNLSGTEKVSGFNKVIISKTHSDCCTDFDRARLAWIFKPVYKKWGYPLPEYRLHFYELLKPFEIEKGINFWKAIKYKFLFLKFIIGSRKFIRNLFGKPNRPILELL